MRNNFLTPGLKVFVGADVRYGLGELELVDVKKDDDKYKKFFWINGDNQRINVGHNKPSPYFINTELLPDNTEAEGETFLIADLEFRQKDPRATHAAYYLGVGSKINVPQNNNNIRLCYGRLEPKNNTVREQSNQS